MRSRQLVVLGIISLLLFSPIQGKSADSWTTMTSTGAQDLNALWGERDNYIFAAGDSGTIIKHTADTDAWDSPAMNSGVITDLFALWGAFGTAGYNNANIFLYAAGTNYILIYTTNGSWELSKGNIAEDIRAVWGASDAIVYAVGDTGIVYFSSDASNTTSAPTWTNIKDTAGTAGIDLLSVWGTSASNVYAGGASGIIFHYNGSIWSSEDIAVGDITGIWGSSATNIYAVTTSGEILHSNGTAWADTGVSAPGGVALYAIWGSSASDVFVAGKDGTVMHTANGTVWDDLTGAAATGGADIYAIWGSTTGNVYFAGEGGLVRHLARETDAIAPKVLSVYPPSITGGYAYVNPQQIGGISVYFSEQMDPTTIAASTITLTLLDNNTAVSGTVTYYATDDAQNGTYAMSANFVPNSNLTYSGNYRLTVTTGAKDNSSNHNALAQEYHMDFTTEPHPESGSGSGGTCFISTARM